jgi:N4-gp56 family major capsid protein
MTGNVNTASGIGYRQNLYADELFLKHATPKLVLERYATAKKLPKKKTVTIEFVRAIPYDVTDQPLQEGVTPTPQGIQYEKVQKQIKQYGNWVQYSDVAEDTLDIDIINEQVPLLGEQAGQQRELINWGEFRSGTNIYYGSTTANPTQRSQVNAPLSLGLIRKVEAFLDDQYASRITKRLAPGTGFGTESVPEGYIGINHTNCRGDLYDIPGFRRAEDYASGKPEPEEVGSVDGVRFVMSAFLKPIPNAGSTTLNGMRSTGGTNVDVYTTLFLAQDAIGVVSLAGTERQIIKMKKPGEVDSGDPLGQRGFVSYKMWHAALILNQNWCVRVEHGATA